MAGRFVVFYYTATSIQGDVMLLLNGVQRLEDMKNHVEVFSEDFDGVQEDNVTVFLERQFKRFNDYATNPLSNNASAQLFVRTHNTHTSMSVGDIIRLDFTGAAGTKQIWAVQGRGWKQIN